MWVIKHTDITQHIPEDDKWHDVQIVNNLIWVDGILKNPPADGFTEFKIFNRMLSVKEIESLMANKSLNCDRAKKSPAS